MSDFRAALNDAMADLAESADPERSARRVAERLGPLRDRGVPLVPALGVALAAALLVGGGVAGYHLSGGDAGGVEVVVEPAPVVRSAAARAELVLAASGGACDFEVDGVSRGRHQSLRVRVAPGSHEVSCVDANDDERVRTIVVEEGDSPHLSFEVPFVATEPETLDSGTLEDGTIVDEGTLVAIAIGGSCAFTIDGKPYGTKSSIRVRVAVGSHEVACGSRTQRVNVELERPGIASFRLTAGDGHDHGF